MPETNLPKNGKFSFVFNKMRRVALMPAALLSAVGACFAVSKAAGS